jgi:hypothetical protein
MINIKLGRNTELIQQSFHTCTSFFGVAAAFGWVTMAVLDTWGITGTLRRLVK